MANRLKLPIKRFGGKWHLAKWIIDHFPKHETYVEPFFGSGSVFFAKEKVPNETVNDLDFEIAGLFRAMRDVPEELQRLCDATEYGRSVFDEAREVLQAGFQGDIARWGWAVLVVHNYRFGGLSGTNISMPATQPYGTRVKVLANLQFRAIAKRLQRTQIEHKDAIDVIERFGVQNSVVYCDPPYLFSTRKTKGAYSVEMGTEDAHEAFLKACIASTAMVYISGYDSELYRDMLHDWHVDSTETVSHVASSIGANNNRTEVLWYNEAAHEALMRDLGPLFSR